MDAWLDTLSAKASELELIASWASTVDLRRVRDFARQARYEIQQEMARVENLRVPERTTDGIASPARRP